jgi:anti-sigma regulatory factor (Ser/Thr protein kinase)
MESTNTKRAESPLKLQKAMFTFDRSTDALHCEFSADLNLMERVLVSVEHFLKEMLTFSAINILLLSRELLVNAIVHGSNYDSGKSVTLDLNLTTDNYLQILVTDEGEGFSYQTIDMTLPKDPQRMSKRGLALVKHLSEKLEFNSKGNQVKAAVKCVYTSSLGGDNSAEHKPAESGGHKR